MVVDTNKEITDFFGQVVRDPIRGDHPWTVGGIVRYLALTVVNLNPVHKERLYKLALHSFGLFDFSDEDRALVLDVAGSTLTPLVYGRLLEALSDGVDKADEDN